jgi:gliding motility-associated-like protein
MQLSYFHPPKKEQFMLSWRHKYLGMKGIKAISLFVLLILAAFSNDVKASHLLGGEIIWECLPSGQYRFTITLYRDCTGIPLNSNTESLSTNSGGTITCTKISTTYINKQCDAPTCVGATIPYIGAIEQHVYRSGPVTLTGTPPAGGWYFSWQSCCRPGTVTNLVSPGGTGYTLRAVMYPYTPPAAGGALSANPCYDNSPSFLEAPDVTVCTSYDAEYMNLGYDEDLDSLYYDWDWPKDDGLGWPAPNVQFLGGYSFTNPLPASANASLDNEIGRVTFNSSIQGSFATCIKIEEWRCGQLIGEVFRDIPIFIKPCSPPAGLCGGLANNAPSLAFQWVPGYDTLTPIYNANNKLTHYEMDVYATTEVKFKLVSQDTDLQPNCAPQSIIFKGQGGNLSSAANYGNANNCLFQTPCATLAPGPGQTGFTTTLNNTVEFTWQTTCDHLTYQPFLCGGLRNTYEFFFRFEDNACPYPAFSYATVKINVLNYPPIPPDMSGSCVTTQPNGDITFDWIEPADTGINFDGYAIFRSNGGSPFTSIDTIYNYLTTSFTDVNPPTGVNQYYVRTLGGCSLISVPSDTIQNIDLTLVAIPPPPNSSIADLSWNAKKPSGAGGEYYQVWREICGTGNWELIDSTQSLDYNDTVNVCGECLKYQIRINNSCNSSVDSGYFADQSNTDIIEIDSVTVQNGMAYVAWDTTSASSDVVEYVLLKQDISGSWVSAATVPIGTAMPYQVPGSNAASEKERYKVVTLDSCGNQSSDLNAVAHNTLYLSVNSDPCDAFVRLRWNSYKQWTQTDVGVYELYADITDNAGNTTNHVLIFQGTPNDTVHDHTSVISGYEYCYYLRATDTTGAYSSTSNKICVSSQVVRKSRLLYMGRATVKTDGSIEVYGYLDPDADVIDFGIERADNRKGPWFTMGRIPKPITGPWELKFNDYSAAPESNTYFYRFTSVDSCGALDTISNISRNILLRAKSNGNLSNTLTWNPYEEFGGEVGKYEVYRMVDYNGSWQLVTDLLTDKDTIFIDDIRPFDESNGAFCYYVRAVESNNPLGFVDEYGLPFSSESNRVCVTQEARIFIPTAFNPNSDIDENRIWRPTNVFARENSYQLIVINRWGDKVFQTTSTSEGWDGTYQGEAQPLGVYTYVIKYRSLEGLPIEERGTFTLLR